MHNSKYACAHSVLADADAAARAAATQVKSRLSEGRLDGVFVFHTAQYEAAAVLAAVRSVFGAETPIAGCQAPGVVFGDRVLQQGVVVAASRCGLSVNPFVSVGADGEQVGRAAAEGAISALRAQGHTIEGGNGLLLLLPDVTAVDSAAAVRGAAAFSGRSVRIAGGGSRDERKAGNASLLCQGDAVQGGVLAVALSCPKPMGLGLRHGAKPWGPPMQATELRGLTLAGIDFVGAFERCRTVASELGAAELDHAGLPAFARAHPLGLPQGDGGFVLRSAVAVEESGALRLCSGIPENAVVQLMQTDPDAVVAAAREAAEEAQREMQPARAGAALVFACVTREGVMAPVDGPSPELVALRESIGPNVPTFGFVSVGAIGGAGNGGPQHHDASFGLCLLPA